MSFPSNIGGLAINVPNKTYSGKGTTSQVFYLEDNPTIRELTNKAFNMLTNNSPSQLILQETLKTETRLNPKT